MDLKGSLVDTNLRIYPSEKLTNFLAALQVKDDTPANLLKFVKGGVSQPIKKQKSEDTEPVIHLNSKDIDNLNIIKTTVSKLHNIQHINSSESGFDISSEKVDAKENGTVTKDVTANKKNSADATKNYEEVPTEKDKGPIVPKIVTSDKENSANDTKNNEEVPKEKYKGLTVPKCVTADKENSADDTKNNEEVPKEKVKSPTVPKNVSADKENSADDTKNYEEVPKEKDKGPSLATSDLDWLYVYLQKRRSIGEKNIPYIHELLEGTLVETPDNKTIKRNPVLEARCVKLRSQQEAREYRKMTKTVDNVRIRFPEDSISYQLKQINRQLIAIGQFIISIFAGFLFGFKGVEWMIGSLDFGFRLLLGVMCALVIALAEIYFLAKKLNEELSVPETVQLGGPPKFADDSKNNYTRSNVVDKEHQD